MGDGPYVGEMVRTLGRWSIGAMVHWSDGPLERWSVWAMPIGAMIAEALIRFFDIGVSVCVSGVCVCVCGDCVCVCVCVYVCV